MPARDALGLGARDASGRRRSDVWDARPEDERQPGDLDRALFDVICTAVTADAGVTVPRHAARTPPHELGLVRRSAHRIPKPTGQRSACALVGRTCHKSGLLLRPPPRHQGPRQPPRQQPRAHAILPVLTPALIQSSSGCALI